MRLRSCISYGLLSAWILSSDLPAENIALYFEDVSSPTAATLSDGTVEDINRNDNGSSDISSDVYKFGRGSLRIADENFWISVRLPDGIEEIFAGDTERMSIVLWVLLPEGNADAGFSIAGRRGDKNAQGAWSFGRHSEKLGLSFSCSHGKDDGNQMVSMGRKPAVPLSTNEWHHLAMVLDGAVVSFYIDGQLIEQRELNVANIPAPGTEDEYKLAMQLLRGLPVGSHVDDFGIFYGTALDDNALQVIVQNGLQAFLEKK